MQERPPGDRKSGRTEAGRQAATAPAHPVTGGSTAIVVRWGWYSVLVNLALIALHGLIAAVSGSLAVAAELIHNVVDLGAAVAVVVGLKLAARRARGFPYGLYKVENLVAAGLAILIFFTAYEVAESALFGAARALRVDTWMLVSLIVTLTIPLVFSHFELRVARATNSPALMADAREYRVHAYTTGLALAALVSARLAFPLDRLAALAIVIAVAKTGWDLLIDALRVLLDASLDPATLDQVRRVIENDPAIAEVKWVTGRNAGRFRFVEVGVTVRLAELARAEAAVARVEAAVRAALPHIERVLLHLEPRTTTHAVYAVPLADLDGVISEHFGEAPYFAFVTVHRPTGEIEAQQVRANPHRAEPRAKGIRVADWLVAEKVDCVFAPKSMEGRGPAYVLRDGGVEVRRTDARTLTGLLQEQGALAFAQAVGTSPPAVDPAQCKGD